MAHSRTPSPTSPPSALRRALIGLAGALAITGSAQAQDLARNIIVPQSRVIVAPDTDRPVSLHSVQATIDIRDQVATTTLRITLHNPAPRPQEAEVVMPVPDGAAIRSFHLEGLGDDGGARLLPKDEARRIYEAIVRRMVDPAILEFAGYGMIRSNVFPVPAGEESVITLVYEQLLPAEGDRVDYLLPRALGASAAEWSIAVTLESHREVVGVYSPTHDLTVDQTTVIPAGGGTPAHRHTYTVKDAAHTGGAFQLAILHQPLSDGAHAGMGATFLAYPDPRVTNGTSTGGYFLMIAGLPELPHNAPRIPRELTLVIDRSGSMRGEKWSQTREAAIQIISALGPTESFNIIDYSDVVESFHSEPVDATPEHIKQGIAYLEGLTPSGGTNIHDALVEALRQPTVKGSLPIVLFLTDGLPTIGQTGEQAIRDAARRGNPHSRRVFTFGVGYDVNTPLLRAIATDSRASSTFVQPGEDVEVKVGQVYRRLRGPVLAGPDFRVDARIAGQPRLVDILPTTLPDVFEGEQIVVMGKYYGDERVSVTISGDYLGEPRSFQARFDPAKATTRNAFVPRLWATRRIGSLLDAIRQNPGSDGQSELVSEIVALSTEFGILTEYTAFLAANPEDMPPTGVPASAPAAWRDNAARELEAGRGLERRMSVRAGGGSMNQELNNAARADALSLAAGVNMYFDEQMNQRQITTVQQIGDRAYFQHGRRWVDSSILAQASDEPDQRVEFGSDAYSTLLDELVAENRQGVLANRGEIYLLHRGQRVLVINPG